MDFAERMGELTAGGMKYLDAIEQVKKEVIEAEVLRLHDAGKCRTEIAAHLDLCLQVVDAVRKKNGLAGDNPNHVKKPPSKQDPSKRKPYYKLNVRHIEEFKRIAAEGMNSDKIAKHFGVSKTTAYTFAKKHGIEVVSRYYTKDQKAEIVNLHLSGTKKVDIGKKMRAFPQTVNRILAEAGYKTKKLHIYDHDEFERLWKMGLTQREIGDRTGATVGLISKVLKAKGLRGPNLYRVKPGTAVKEVTEALNVLPTVDPSPLITEARKTPQATWDSLHGSKVEVLQPGVEYIRTNEAEIESLKAELEKAKARNEQIIAWGEELFESLMSPYSKGLEEQLHNYDEFIDETKERRKEYEKSWIKREKKKRMDKND